MYSLNCIDISESEAFNTVKSIFWTFFLFSFFSAVTLLPPCADFRISSKALYRLLLGEKVHELPQDKVVSCACGYA